MPADLQWPYELRMWPLGKLYVDKAYQRPLTNLVKRIVDDFDPRMLAPIVVSERKKGANGAIVDGQTRVQALKMLGFTEIPALTFRGTRKEEAALFARFQKERRNITPYQRFKALLTAEDETALAVNATLKARGYEFTDSGATVRPWTIQAVAACERLHARGSLDRVLWVTSNAWPTARREQHGYGQGHPLNNEILIGLDLLLRSASDIDDARMAERLKPTTPQEIVLRAGHLRQGRGMGGGSAKYVVQVLTDLYENRRRAPQAA